MDFETNKSLNRLKENFKTKKVFNHPILNHPLGDCDANTQDMYFTLLYILANYNNAINENQTQFLDRLLLGINNKNNLTDFYKKAISIAEDFPDQIVNSFISSDLRYNLLVDMLIILSLADMKETEQIELVSETSLVLGIGLNEVNLSSKIARSILEQDERFITGASTEKNNLLYNFLCYIKDFYEGVLSFSEDLIYCFSKDGRKLPFKSILARDTEVVSTTQENMFNPLQMNFESEMDIKSTNNLLLTSKKVIIKNYFLENEGLRITIENCDYVEFDNCDFIKPLVIPISIINCKQVVFRNCTFRDFDNKAIIFYEGQSFMIENCSFINCNHHRIIDFKKLSRFFLTGSTFYKISFKQLSESIFTIEEWPEIFSVTFNEFKECKNISGFGSLLISSNAEINKDNNIMIDDNVFEKCFASFLFNCDYLKPIHYKNNRFISGSINAILANQS